MQGEILPGNPKSFAFPCEKFVLPIELHFASGIISKNLGHKFLFNISRPTNRES